VETTQTGTNKKMARNASKTKSMKQHKYYIVESVTISLASLSCDSAAIRFLS